MPCTNDDAHESRSRCHADDRKVLDDCHGPLTQHAAYTLRGLPESGGVCFGKSSKGAPGALLITTCSLGKP